MTEPVDFDDYVGNYNQLLRDQTSFFSPSEEYFARYKVDIVRERLQEPVRRLLEYGCGIGRNIRFLQQAFPGAEIIGSDISRASLDVARQENVGVDFFEEYEGIAAPGQFDVIFVAGVFHHVPPPLRASVSQTLLDRLRPGGKLFVFEHNPYNPVTRRIVSTCPYDADAVLLKPSELKGTLTNAGLAVEQQEYCLFVPPSLSSFAWLEKRLAWLPLGGQYWVQACRPR